MFLYKAFRGVRSVPYTALVSHGLWRVIRDALADQHADQTFGLRGVTAIGRTYIILSRASTCFVPPSKIIVAFAP